MGAQVVVGGLGGGGGVGEWASCDHSIHTAELPGPSPSRWRPPALHAAMAWVGVCPSGPGGVRLRGQVEGDSDDKALQNFRTQARFGFSEPPHWLQERVDQVLGGGAPQAGRTSEAPREGGGAPNASMSLIGLLWVEPGEELTSPLAPRSQEVDIQCVFFGDPRDAYTLNVRSSWKMDPPVNILLRRPTGSDAVARCPTSIGGQKAFIPVLDTADLEALCSCTKGPAHGDARELKDLLQKDGQLCVADFVCLVVLSPIAELATQGRWDELVWMARWQIPRPLFTPPFPHSLFVLRTKGLHEKDRHDGGPEAGPWRGAEGRLVSAVAHLKDWSQDIIRAAQAREGNEGATAAEASLTGIVKALQDMAHSFGGRPSRGWKANQQRWDASSLILCLHTVDSGSSGSGSSASSRVVNARDRAVALGTVLFPGLRLDPGQVNLPSRQCLQRARFQLDVALMLLHRHSPLTTPPQLQLCGGGAPIPEPPPLRQRSLYGWADASPQGEREWLLSEHLVIHEADLLPAFAAAQALAWNGGATVEERRQLDLVGAGCGAAHKRACDLGLGESRCGPQVRRACARTSAGERRCAPRLERICVMDVGHGSGDVNTRLPW